jgi:hypothetical protein
MRVLCLLATVSLLFAISKEANAQKPAPTTSQQTSTSLHGQDADDDEFWDWEGFGSACADPAQRHATISGSIAIAGYVYPDGTLDGKPLKFADVQVYSSSGQLAYAGKTDKSGWFVTRSLNPGIYRIVIDGWGSTTVRLRLALSEGEGLGGMPSLRLVENECVLVSN